MVYFRCLCSRNYIFFIVNKFLLRDVSQSADTISAISGFAISVSGSVVAILIAAQALRQQDEISKVEKTALAAEEAARKVENKLQELDRQREQERELRESISPLRDFLASSRMAFNAVEIAAQCLAKAAEASREEYTSSEFEKRISAPRDEAVNALRNLADSLATWSDVRVLTDAMQEGKRANASGSDAEVGELISYMSKVFVNLRDLSQSVEMKTLEAARSKDKELEKWNSWIAEEHEKELHRELEDSINSEEYEDFPASELYEWLKPDHYRSTWYSSLPPKIKSGNLISGLEPSNIKVPFALPECITLIRKMAAELSTASAEILWCRAIQANFATRVLMQAVFDPRKPGGYHLTLAQRRIANYSPRAIQNKDPAEAPDVSNDGTESKGSAKKSKARRFPSPSVKAVAKKDVNENALLQTSSWLDNFERHGGISPLNSFLMLADPSGYFATFDGEFDRELEKGGSLPRFPLLLNRGASILLRTLAELPSLEEIKSGIGSKMPDIPVSAKRMILGDDIEKFFHTALPIIMPEIQEAPDKIYFPALEMQKDVFRCELGGIDVKKDVKSAMKRETWPPYPEWPGVKPPSPRPRLKLRPPNFGEIRK